MRSACKSPGSNFASPDAYPAAIVVGGVRIPLKRETLFTRFYECPERRMMFSLSRFADGSATMTFHQLAELWPRWTKRERAGFCSEIVHLHEQADYLDMLRFIMRHGHEDHGSAIALRIANRLPADEAFAFLRRALPKLPLGYRGNITQAITATRHPEAAAVLREQLELAWSNGALWEDNPFLNWVAAQATALMGDLIELGTSPAEFEDRARALFNHRCAGNRRSFHLHLGKHYAWCPPPPPLENEDFIQAFGRGAKS